jgi:hypothetical protein
MNSEDMTKHRIVIIVSVATVLFHYCSLRAILIFDLAGLPLYYRAAGALRGILPAGLLGMRSNVSACNGMESSWGARCWWCC